MHVRFDAMDGCVVSAWRWALPESHLCLKQTLQMETSAQSAQSLPRENAGPQMSPQHAEHPHQTQWPRWQNPEEDKLDRRNIIQNSESLLPASSSTQLASHKPSPLSQAIAFSIGTRMR